MVQVPFIEKPLRESKNYSKVGRLFEKFVCRHIHSHKERVPVLVSPKLLRSKMLGQVDCAWLEPQQSLIVAECKSGRGYLMDPQRRRLEKSCFFLSQLFNKKTVLVRIRPVAKMLDADYPFIMDVIKELAL